MGSTARPVPKDVLDSISFSTDPTLDIKDVKFCHRLVGVKPNPDFPAISHPGVSHITVAVIWPKHEDYHHLRFVGLAKCLEIDNFCKKTGRTIAHGRAELLMERYIRNEFLRKNFNPQMAFIVDANVGSLVHPHRRNPQGEQVFKRHFAPELRKIFLALPGGLFFEPSDEERRVQ